MKKIGGEISIKYQLSNFFWFVHFPFREIIKAPMGHLEKTNTVRSVMKYAVSEVCHLFSISTAEEFFTRTE